MLIYSKCSSMEDILEIATICSLVIMWTGAKIQLSALCYYFAINSNSHKTSSFSGATIKIQALIAFTDSMTSVCMK